MELKLYQFRVSSSWSDTYVTIVHTNREEAYRLVCERRQGYTVEFDNEIPVQVGQEFSITTEQSSF